MKMYLTVINDRGNPNIVEISSSNIDEVNRVIAKGLLEDTVDRSILDSSKVSGRIIQIVFLVESVIEKLVEDQVEVPIDTKYMADIVNNSAREVALDLGKHDSTIKKKLAEVGLRMGEFYAYCCRLYESGGNDTGLFDLIRGKVYKHSASEDMKAIEYMEKRVKEILKTGI